ncbi:hypothetical protein KC952_02135 [Candidatus Saccharibacteria bacterium]|jgi:hypothetical protein|nr:hypothetical protein [Candidatus Saccharibacteria bacterium]
MTAPEVLVIILSIFLAIFLAIGIILGILLIRITLQIKHVTEKAEKTADNIETITSTVASSSFAALNSMFIAKALKKWMKTSDNSKKRR